MSAEHIRQRYGVLLRRYTQTGGEAELAALATLGRDAISIDLPPEEIGAIHNAALADLVATSAEPKLSEIIESTSLPLIEVLMAYGLAFREEAARRDAVVEALKSSEELYRQMFRSNRALQLLIDPNDGAIVDANPAAEDYYLPSTGEMKGLRLTDITADADEFLERALGEARRESQGHLVFRHRLGDGSLRDVEVYLSHVTIKGRPLLHWIVHDITDRKRNEATIHHLATHDALTDLANRSLFQERLQEALAAAGRAQHHVAVIFVDLDRFKDVNDTLGHPVGDLLLKEVAQRLRICARDTDTVARLGGDEFALIATNVHQVADATVLATRIIESLAQPFMLDTHHVYSGASVGITLYPTDGKDADHLIKNADLALYRAKKNGRETYQFYNSQMQKEVQIKKQSEYNLRQGLKNKELVTYYQPQISLFTGEVVGMEALVRWNCPKRGLIAPQEFIPLAEELGLILDIGKHVLSSACKQGEIRASSGLPALQIAINVSPRQFQRKDFADTVDIILGETGFDPQYLELELTEGHLTEDIEEAIRTLNVLKSRGLHISIDDFGTGYSSLSQLKDMPVDTLKIDRSFVRNMVMDSSGGAIAETIIKLGHSLGLRVIAEGVETLEQITRLRRSGCDVAQGFFYSMALPPEEFATWFTGYAIEGTEIAG